MLYRFVAVFALLWNLVGLAMFCMQVTLTPQADRQHACLHIIDQGPGLSEELLQRLYQPFSAGDTRNGSGLGLAICLEIVQALHGRLELHNRQQGTRILGLEAVACLPMAPAEAA